MDSYSECEQFDIKQEMDLLPVTEIKTEPLDIKSEVEEDETYKIIDHVDVKHEMKPINYCVGSTETSSEMEDTKENLDKLLEGCRKRSRQEQHNAAKDESNVVSITSECCETFQIGLDERKCVNASNSTRESVEEYTTTNLCNNQNDTRNYTSTHEDEKLFKCDCCNLSFAQKYTLNAHKRMCHISEKSCKCHLCDRSFVQNYLLVAHMRSHTGEKPFRCKFCQKPFSNRRSLVKHVNEHTS